MSAPTVARDVAPAARQTSYSIQGRCVRVPFEVRDATAAVAFYLVSAPAAQHLIGGNGLRIASVAPGRTICTIGAIAYKDGEIGSYNEMAVTFFVHEPGSSSIPYLGALVGMLRSHLSAYVHRLPVSTGLSCEVGQTIWGLPKFVADITIKAHGDTETADLTEDGQHVLTQSMTTGGSRTIVGRNQVSYAVRDGMLHRSTSVMNGEQVGIRMSGASLELGTHPIADELRGIGLPKRPLFTTYMGKMTGVFHDGERTRIPPA